MIEHKGQMTADGEGQGHYTCDVKTKDGSWYRTNDNKIPSQISRNNLSKRSVVVLYSKIKHLEHNMYCVRLNYQKYFVCL